MVIMQDEVEKTRARIVKKLNKRKYFVYHRGPVEDDGQYITGFVREVWNLMGVGKDGTVSFCVIKTPYRGRYGPQVYAKLRPNGRFWFISNAYADTLPTDVTETMERLAAGDSGGMEIFDANDLTKIYD